MLKLCALADLAPGKPRLAKVGDHHMLVVRTGTAEVHLYLNRCPHLHIPLAWDSTQLLSPDGQYFQCSTHGALFELDSGFCISGPCYGDQLWSFTCTVTGGEIFIDESELPAPPSVS
jgi:nitrite reductase/ring-hydroxylating ferredoxin subunit